MIKQRREKISEFKVANGLPEDAEFKGYAVHLEKTDEFLASELENDDMYLRSWGKIPELAKLYQSANKAEKAAKRAGNNAVMVLIFEDKNRYFVFISK
jgi:hypothetical protein